MKLTPEGIMHTSIVQGDIDSIGEKANVDSEGYLKGTETW